MLPLDQILAQSKAVKIAGAGDCYGGAEGSCEGRSGCQACGDRRGGAKAGGAQA